MNKLCLLLLILPLTLFQVEGKEYSLYSPNKKIEIKLSIDERVSISILNNNKVLLEPSAINITIDKKALFVQAKVSKTTHSVVRTVVRPIVRIKSAEIDESYDQLVVAFKENYSLVVRAYNEGVAYRLVTNFKEPVIVNQEELQFNLPPSSIAWLMQEKSFHSMSESPYVCKAVNELEDSALFSAPFLFQVANSGFLLISESDLIDYPGLWIRKVGGKLQATFPQKVTKTKEGSCLSERNVTERADYLAETTGKRNYPWRAFVVTDTEKELITNQLIYLLATPNEPGDYSWIKPGLTTLDWWGRRNVYGTDFKGGVNTETHKYFVDFNHQYGLRYFVLDEGWTQSCDLRNTNPNLDLDELKAYAESKDVGLVFWVHAFALKQDIPGYLDFLKSKGAKGIKVDFFERDDQDAINLINDIAREAMTRQMIVDFHGVCKPFGINRTYPNVLTSEGLVEFEMNGVTDWANPLHHTLLPFIRMVTGPMDYLPGTLNNAQKGEFHKNGNRPVGLGSRSHSMALSVICESPLTMLPDSPSDYLKEDESTSFLSQIPVVWDETKVLDAKIGQYIILARRSGTDWFVGAITNWDARECSVTFDFLPTGNYTLDCFTDGVNTSTRAIDYKRVTSTVNPATTISMSLSIGGGWVGKISKK